MGKLPKSLNYGNTDARAVDVDWAESFDDYEIIVPAVTFDAINDYAPQMLNGMTRRTFDRSPAKRAAIVKAFEESDIWHEWVDSFRPMMNYAWPLFMGGRDPAAVATLIDEFAPCCALIEVQHGNLRDRIGEDYAIALTGGGMDLSDHLVLAYICAEAVPPLTLLRDLARTLRDGGKPGVKPALREAYRLAIAGLQSDINHLKRERSRISGRSKEESEV